MKVLQKGNLKKRNDWWHEKIGTCPTCGEVIQLEQPDEMKIGFIRGTLGEVHMQCLTCNNYITFTKDERP